MKRYKKKEKILTNDVSLSILYEWLAKVGHGTGDWSNGMIGVSKTFGGSSILSSPALKEPELLENKRFWLFCFIRKIKGYQSL